ncbi:hypothetical protein Ancab_026281 [Ancistrocladus abbreviatus]
MDEIPRSKKNVLFPEMVLRPKECLLSLISVSTGAIRLRPRNGAPYSVLPAKEKPSKAAGWKAKGSMVWSGDRGSTQHLMYIEKHPVRMKATKRMPMKIPIDAFMSLSAGA